MVSGHTALESSGRLVSKQGFIICSRNKSHMTLFVWQAYFKVLLDLFLGDINKHIFTLDGALKKQFYPSVT